MIGHTIVPEIKGLYNNVVYPIDVDRRKSDSSALWIEGGRFFKINAQAKKIKI